MKTYDWQSKLEEGKSGEEQVLAWFARTHRDARIDDVREVRSYQAQDIDFVVGKTTYEIKTDLKAHETGNLFLEFDALEKSKADYWLIYVPQRGWLFEFDRCDLQAYAELCFEHARTVTTEHQGRQWSVSGVPLRMSRLLIELAAHLHTGLARTEGVAA